MGLFRRPKDLEVMTSGHDDYFSVAGRHKEPVVEFELVPDDEDDDPRASAAATLPPSRLDPRFMPRAGASFPAGPRGSIAVYSAGAAAQPAAPMYVTPRPVREPRQEPAAVQTEWARRAVGPVDASRARGMCSGCGTILSVSRAPRPLRTACPVCGRTRVLN